MANQAKLRSFRTAPKYMYGYEIPKHYADALRLDRLHGNTKWQDATKAEMDQLAEYKVFVDIGLGTPIPKGYQKIRVHLVFACKHDGRHKARLVADGHLTEDEVNSYLLVTFWYRGAKPYVNEYFVLGQLVHFCLGCVLPLRIAMESVKSKGIGIVLRDFVSVHVLGSSAERTKLGLVSHT